MEMFSTFLSKLRKKNPKEISLCGLMLTCYLKMIYIYLVLFCLSFFMIQAHLYYDAVKSSFLCDEQQMGFATTIADKVIGTNYRNSVKLEKVRKV